MIKVQWLFASLVLACVDAATAHIDIGDPIPIVELVDEDAIDLHDGSLADWFAAVGPPTLTSHQFNHHFEFSRDPYDRADFDHNIWLAWHRRTNRIYVAAELLDDHFVNQYAGVDAEDEIASTVTLHDGAVALEIDGDHSGGGFHYYRNCCGPDDGTWLEVHDRQAQLYVAAASAPDGRHVGLLPLAFHRLAAWATQPPYADGRGVVEEGETSRAVVEFYITPFDGLDWEGPGLSAATPLRSGLIIGLRIALFDFDEAPGAMDALRTVPVNLFDLESDLTSADFFTDAVLVGGELAETEEETAVETRSWGVTKRLGD